MNFFKNFTFSRILILLMTIAVMIPSAVLLDCSPSTGSIRCDCTTTTAECFGTQFDLFEAEEILKNLSKKENVVFKINDLQFDSGFVLENSDIKNLTLGYTKYELRVLSVNFFSKVSSSLISLNLQNNSITKIDDAFFSNFTLLRELFIDNNEIENLTANTFTNLNNLKYLSLSYNNISEITPQVFQNLNSLETLVLSYNKFLLIENINIKCATLTELRIDNCLIEGLVHENTMANIPATEKLDISYNKLSGIRSKSFSSLKNLKYLNLSYNAIEYLEENAFSFISNLTTLDLQGNKISVIKLSSFEKLQKLKYLDLSGNKLKAVLCEYTTDFTSLESIYLQNNEIKTFTPGAFFYSPTLKIMNLTGNNLECSCPLTDSALYLIENGTMERADFDSVFCIIPSTGQMMQITEYESSKCVPVEPCKKPEIIDDEDYDYNYEDIISSSTTLTPTPSSMSTDETTEKSTTLLSTAKLILNETEVDNITKPLSTVEYNATDTITMRTNSEDITVPIEITTVSYSENVSDNTSEEPNTTISSEVLTAVNFINESEATDIKLLTTIEYNTPNTTTTSIDSKDTTVPFIETTTKSTTEKVSDSTVEKPNTTLSSEITTKSTLSTSTTEKIFSSSEAISIITSPDSDSDCSKLQLFISNASLSSDFTVHKNFSYKNNIFCLKWTAGSTDHLKSSTCVIKLQRTGTEGMKRRKLTCPTALYEIKDWSIYVEKLFKFCIQIYLQEKKIDSCESLTSKESSMSTTFTTSMPTESSTVENTVGERSTVEYTAAESATKLATTVVDKSVTNATIKLSSTANAYTASITAIPAVYSTNFMITALDLYFNDSKLAFTTWAVNKWQPLRECNLTLKVSTQYFDEIEGVFPCKNNTYRLTTVKEDDIFKVCLFSYHVISGKDNLCQHTLPSAKAATIKEDSLHSSLIPLICLLIFVGIIILYIVIKNISKRRTVSKKYDVQAEEEKYQERTKLRPQSVHEESVRFSYIAKESHD